jgi:ubiquinone/menaquinone biosynthesis C-methylase UbiE
MYTKTPNTQHPTPNTQHPTPNTQHPTPNIIEERVIREKEWHNQTFGSEVRRSTGKFYSIFRKIDKDINDRIVSELACDTTKFLEYGCGPGYYLLQIANKIKEGIGIDISEALIEYAKSVVDKNNIKNVNFFVMDAMNTTFNNEEFDIIHGQSILHHLDLELSLNEIKRILKNQGVAYFIEPLDTNPIIKLYRTLTPNARTEDEQPLRRKDIKTDKKYISKNRNTLLFLCFFTCGTIS